MLHIEGIERIEENLWRLARDEEYGMRTHGLLLMSEPLLDALEPDTVVQLKNVATLPGIFGPAMVMPDAHLGYGFPIGGVAAFDLDEGVISPGGVGFDINCGVRVMRTSLKVEQVRPHLKELTELLFRYVPSGLGSKSRLRLTDSQLTDILLEGSRWAVEQGFGIEDDLDRCEEGGVLEGASAAHVSKQAYKRGRPQMGTLGSGNHFLEVQVVDEVYDPCLGIEKGDITVMIHCGSRGCGHQICTDHLKVLNRASKEYGIPLKDKQLACAPIRSKEGESYLSAMAAAANYAWANRQTIMHWVREAFCEVFGGDIDELGMRLIYDVAHNIAKMEQHTYDGETRRVCVHRKGATRALPAGHDAIPKAYRDVGQPVLIPGSMGTASFILVGEKRAMELSFGSACHGAGRVMSRTRAKKTFSSASVSKSLSERGIVLRAASQGVVSEEAPQVYKDSEAVVDVMHSLGVARKVARLMPIGVVKG
ncbi:MAG: RtcB family protein [Methermicoccaceae archaeon]